jgi:enoyl-CoA hydratase/carnithine racemase
MTESPARSRVGPMAIHTASDGRVAEVVFERDGVLNAFGPEDLPALAAALRSAGRSGVDVVVVRGGGGAFSAGDDLKQTAELDASGWRAVVEAFHELTRVVRSLDVPVICAIDGPCVGGAFEFACSCDLRIATTRARLGCPEVQVGIAISNGASALLSHVCGATFANELMLTGRLVAAQEALQRGILNRVVEPEELDQAVAELAAQIAAQAPLAVRATKRMIVAATDAVVEAAMARETEAGEALFATSDFAEGLAAFREKREPSFEGR